MNETHGKDMNAPKAKPKTLDEIWGFKIAKFPTNDENVYIASLKVMNKADLQSECLRIHETPHDERARMEDKLLKQFRRWTGTTNTAHVQAAVIPTDTDRSAKARRVLANLTNSAMGL